MSTQASTDLREEVRSRYAAAARAILEPEAGAADSCCGGSASASCCGTGSSAAEAVGGFSEHLYPEDETAGLPEDAVLASLGCGNPLAVADLHEGERVLDLGSGGGIDVLLSARRVGPDRIRLRGGHDRRDADAGPRERREGGRDQRRVPQGRDRGASRCPMRRSTW